MAYLISQEAGYDRPSRNQNPCLSWTRIVAQSSDSDDSDDSDRDEDVEDTVVIALSILIGSEVNLNFEVGMPRRHGTTSTTNSK